MHVFGEDDALACMEVCLDAQIRRRSWTESNCNVLLRSLILILLLLLILVLLRLLMFLTLHLLIFVIGILRTRTPVFRRRDNAAAASQRPPHRLGLPVAATHLPALRVVYPQSVTEARGISD